MQEKLLRRSPEKEQSEDHIGEQTPRLARLPGRGKDSDSKVFQIALVE